MCSVNPCVQLESSLSKILSSVSGIKNTTQDISKQTLAVGTRTGSLTRVWHDTHGRGSRAKDTWGKKLIQYWHYTGREARPRGSIGVEMEKGGEQIYIWSSATFAGILKVSCVQEQFIWESYVGRKGKKKEQARRLIKHTGFQGWGGGWVVGYPVSYQSLSLMRSLLNILDFKSGWVLSNIIFIPIYFSTVFSYRSVVVSKQDPGTRKSGKWAKEAVGADSTYRAWYGPWAGADIVTVILHHSSS